MPKQSGSKLAQYVFFTTDTVATRLEALEFKDLVLFSERGMPEEEWELVRRWKLTANSNSNGAARRYGGGGGVATSVNSAPRPSSSSPPSIPLSRASDAAYTWTGPAVYAATVGGKYQGTKMRSEGAAAGGGGGVLVNAGEVKKHPKLCKDASKKLCGKVGYSKGAKIEIDKREHALGNYGLCVLRA